MFISPAAMCLLAFIAGLTAIIAAYGIHMVVARTATALRRQAD